MKLQKIKHKEEVLEFTVDGSPTKEQHRLIVGCSRAYGSLFGSLSFLKENKLHLSRIPYPAELWFKNDDEIKAVLWKMKESTLNPGVLERLEIGERRDLLESRMPGHPVSASISRRNRRQRGTPEFNCCCNVMFLAMPPVGMCRVCLQGRGGRWDPCPAPGQSCSNGA